MRRSTCTEERECATSVRVEESVHRVPKRHAQVLRPFQRENVMREKGERETTMLSKRDRGYMYVQEA